MRRVLALGLILVALVVSGCGGTRLSTQRSVPVAPTPLIAATPTTTPVVVATTQVQIAQAQAAQLEVAEQHYATCLAYAGLNQSLVESSTSTNSPVAPLCSTAGLSPAEAQVIRGLLAEA